ncbi:hypothetical protein [Methylobacillus sp. Pita1]|uniref:hypothetical protein n=1 Tax=Methylobacillus sp. Pita1 TaxID=3382642 RepID=UPI0038B65095
MQPFDGGIFDKRYEDTFSKAIIDAGLEPYRVDQDPKVSIPIQDIENGIRDSKICFAEITQDNPNVWFELGYAISAGKEVVMVCSAERKIKFPFDVQHRSIIKYDTDSASDYEKLKERITSRLKALIQKDKTLPQISELTNLNTIEGLEQHEIVFLAAMAENLDHPEDHVTAYQIKNDMEKSGFTKIAANLALKSLMKKNLVSSNNYQEWNSEPYIGFSFTEDGWNWVISNQSQFLLKKPITKPDFSDFEDDIPF